MNFEAEMRGFSESIRAMQVAAIAVNSGISVQREGVRVRTVDFISEHGIEAVNSDGNTSFTLHPRDISEYEKLERLFRRLETAQAVLPKSFVVTIVSMFDAHLGRIMKLMFNHRPEMLNSSDRSVKFSDIFTATAVEDLKNTVIEKEIESVLRNSHEEQIVYMENKLSTPLRKLDSWKDFIEVTERRNLFVHTDGIVSSQYISKCSAVGVKGLEDIGVGSQLDCTDKYIKHAIDTIFEIGVKLSYVAWRKLFPDEGEKADSVYLDVCYQLVKEGKHKLAIKMYDLILNSPGHTREIETLALINKMQCLKWSKKDRELNELLDRFDTGVLEHKYKLAKAVLSDDFDSASRFMMNISEEEIPKSEYLLWPLFREFRNTPQFLGSYQTKFGEDPSISEKVKTDQLAPNRPQSDSSVEDEATAEESPSEERPQKRSSKPKKKSDRSNS